MTNSTPTSRSFAVFLILLTLVLLSAFSPASWFGVTPKKQIHPKLNLNLATSPSEIAKDTNHDGAIAWDEVVSQTFKASTSTLEEIKKTPIDQKSIDELNDPDNLTSSFSKNLYLATAYLEQQGTLDDQSKQDTITYLMSLESSKIKPTVHTTKDIRIALNETQNSIKVYGNTISPLVQQIISTEIIKSDLTSLSLFTQTKDEKDLLPIKQNKMRIDKIIQKLENVEVPPSAITYHILMLNRIAMYRDTLDNLSKANSDPVRTTLSLDTYPKAAFLIMKLPNQFSDYFILNNITFSGKEAGYIFTTGYTYK